jgi:uridine kinase
MADLRATVVTELAERIEALRRPHSVCVAIDGIDAAGKTTLADELASVLRRRGREVVRVSIDAFHRPRAERYRRGELSPGGYYRTRSTMRLCERRSSSHSARTRSSSSTASSCCVRSSSSSGTWIFVSVEPEEALRRALERDTPRFGSREEAERRYRRRYQPGQRLYFAEARPLEAADVVVRTGRAEPAPR